MRVFVTGGTGYLGAALLRLGPGQPWVLGASYFSGVPKQSGVEWVWLDIRDARAVEQALARFRPEVVIHTAYSKAGPEALEAITVQGSAHLARACAKVGARLIHLSTDQVFDGEHPPYAESAQPNPITPYGQAKLEAERLVQAHLPQATIVRTSLIWGFDPIDPNSQMVLEMADGKRAGGLFVDEYRSFVFVEDLAQALLELVSLDFQGVLHLGGAEVLSRLEFGRLIAPLHGRDPARLPAERRAEFSEPRPANCALDSSLARSLLHTRLRGVREVLHGLR
ncbi:MAG: SDR family oxidoreductase [Meiothermus sp.]|uniref:SDR family oxidoreductase n=1 Tax=Meiothermus sp. TaxID=1955249 RepID=UPI0025D6B6BF|nr:SDR family oxidoreductase [Meiothermus sp.]MCS7068146.1 SDR family oxidoreductase [Meiothermus sp.]MDW8424576.1 SDR family oxidoreductase [Meiothermus sp.]